MTDNLEKQFFDTFGIEPKYKTCIFKYCKNKKEYDCENCNDREWHYPQITSDILLELICIEKQLRSINFNYEDFKCEILNRLIGMSKSKAFTELAKHQVQALFKEQQND